LLRQQIEKRARTTAGIYKISQRDVEEFVLPLPPEGEQEQVLSQFDERLSVVATLEGQIEANLKRAARLRQSILKRAFEGRLVPQDPTDEPAEKLLERIRAAAESKRGNSRFSARRGRSKQPTFFEDE
jgi:type I restriction enzyme S subunit